MEEQVGGVGAGGPGPTHLFGMGGGSLVHLFFCRKQRNYKVRNKCYDGLWHFKPRYD